MWATSQQRNIPVATPTSTVVGIPSVQRGEVNGYGTAKNGAVMATVIAETPTATPVSDFTSFESCMAFLKALIRVPKFREDILDEHRTHRITTVRLAYYYLMRTASSEERHRATDMLFAGIRATTMELHALNRYMQSM